MSATALMERYAQRKQKRDQNILDTADVLRDAEKLASEKSEKIRTRQQALQTIFFDHLDIFYPTILICFRKRRVFQQPQGVIASNAT
jgi:hypothetical protein